MTAAPGLKPTELDDPVDDEAWEDQPRFAAQRAAAAQIAQLPKQLLLNRARSEGAAHRRSESGEFDTLP